MVLHQHVIDVYFHVMSNLVTKDFVDELLVGGSSILQAEEYNFVAVQPLVSDEHHLLLFSGAI